MLLPRILLRLISSASGFASSASSFLNRVNHSSCAPTALGSRRCHNTDYLTTSCLGCLSTCPSSARSSSSLREKRFTTSGFLCTYGISRGIAGPSKGLLSQWLGYLLPFSLPLNRALAAPQRVGAVPAWPWHTGCPCLEQCPPLLFPPGQHLHLAGLWVQKTRRFSPRCTITG